MTEKADKQSPCGKLNRSYILGYTYVYMHTLYNILKICWWSFRFGSMTHVPFVFVTLRLSVGRRLVAMF